MPPSSMPAAPVATPEPLSVGSFIRFGWETFKKRPWFFILSLIIFGLASAVINIFGSIVQTLVDGHATSGIGHLLSWLISNAGSIMVGLGTIAFFIKAHDSTETATYYDAWRPELFLKYLGVYILLLIVVLVGFLLLIIPGIIAALTFGFAPYLVIDKGLGPIEAMKESARITKGSRWRILAFGGASALLTILGLICLFVGIFVAAPVITLAQVHMYRRISAAADMGVRTPLTGGEKTLIGLGILIPVVIGILAAVVLASLSVARSNGSSIFTTLQLKQLQMEAELYDSENGSYPASLADITAKVPGAVDATKFTYETDAQGKTYKICAVDKVPAGQDQCVTSKDSTSTSE